MGVAQPTTEETAKSKKKDRKKEKTDKGDKAKRKRYPARSSRRSKAETPSPKPPVGRKPSVVPAHRPLPKQPPATPVTPAPPAKHASQPMPTHTLVIEEKQQSPENPTVKLEATLVPQKCMNAKATHVTSGHVTTSSIPTPTKKPRALQSPTVVRLDLKRVP